MKVCVIRSYKRLQIGTDIRCRVLHKPVVLVLQRCSGILLCQDLVLSSVTTETLPVSTSHVHGIAKSVTVALGVPSVMVSGLACGSGTRAPLWPILPSTDTRVVSVVLRVNVLRSTHNCPPRSKLQFASKRQKVGVWCTEAPHDLQ
jgi:hypothetical protein